MTGGDNNTSADVFAKVDAENREHVRLAIETLLHPEQLAIDQREASVLHRVDDNELGAIAERLTFASSGGDDYMAENEADVALMNQTFSQMFSRPRSDTYSKRLKETARQAIIAKFKEYRLDTFMQTFTAHKRSKVNKGTNLIGNFQHLT